MTLGYRTLMGSIMLDLLWFLFLLHMRVIPIDFRLTAQLMPANKLFNGFSQNYSLIFFLFYFHENINLVHTVPSGLCLVNLHFPFSSIL